MYKKLLKLQSELKAPKNQYNKFGDYNYRSCEDILEALKPLLSEQELLLTINDELVSLDGWYYVRATITITDGTNTIETSALARETESRPKFDSAQLTGSASSYARKYALNGMFLIDDNKDSDDTNKGENKTKKNGADKPKYITASKHRGLETLIKQKGVDRDGIHEAIGNMRDIHPSDKEFKDIHLNEITEVELAAITKELKTREDK